jgi:leader peptidase (prepilin peptidase) / N-methyltransferase
VIALCALVCGTGCLIGKPLSRGWDESRVGIMGLVGRAALITIVVAGVGIAAFSFYAFAPRTALVSCLLGWGMLAIAAIDARHFTIPDILSLPAIPLGLIASGWLLDPWSSQLVSLDHVIGACLGAAGFWLVREAYWRWRGREGLGLGDVKLAAVGGAWVGWERLADVLLLAAAGALSFAIALAVVRRGRLSGSERIPFGTFLAPSIWGVWCLRAYATGL